MGEYFRGWSRKLSLMMLVVALTVLGGWGRSHITENSACFPIPFGKQITLYGRLTRSGIEFSTTRIIELDSDQQIRVIGNRVTIENISNSVDKNDNRHPSAEDTARESQAMTIRVESVFCESRATVIPYWNVIMPLTILSACLLLSGRRKPKAAKKTFDETV